MPVLLFLACRMFTSGKLSGCLSFGGWRSYPPLAPVCNRCPGQQAGISASEISLRLRFIETTTVPGNKLSFTFNVNLPV
jgi:hypothetical protein